MRVGWQPVVKAFAGGACAVAVALAGGACGAEPGDEQGMEAAVQQRVQERLRILGTTASMTAIEPGTDEGAALLADLDARWRPDEGARKWLDGAGAEKTPAVAAFRLKSGAVGRIATRHFGRQAQGTTVTHALTLVVPPAGQGTPFVYGERHVRAASGVDKVQLVLLEGRLRLAGGFTFDPANPPRTNTALASADLSLGGSLQPLDHAKDRPKPSATCMVCADGLLVAKIIGISAAYATGTGAATAVCALVGIPTAELGGVACHLIAVALSTAAFLPFEFDGRAGTCNWVTHDVLGMDPICEGIASVPAPLPPVPSGS